MTEEEKSSSILDLQLLHHVLSTQSKYGATDDMKKLILKKLKRWKCEVKEDRGNIYVTKGKATVYPTLVAHMDTIHPVISRFEVQTRNQLLVGINAETNTRVGGVGDGKVGVYLALKLLQTQPILKVVFFNDSCKNRAGSKVALTTFFNDSAFIAGLDRAGRSDFVRHIHSSELYGNDFSEAVAPYLNEYNYFETTGLQTDVSELKSGTSRIGVSAFNMSLGYYNANSEAEYVIRGHVAQAQKLLTTIVSKLGDERWTHYSKYVYDRPTAYYPMAGSIEVNNGGGFAPITRSLPAIPSNTSGVNRYGGTTYTTPVPTRKPTGDVCKVCGKTEVYEVNRAVRIKLCEDCGHILHTIIVPASPKYALITKVEAVVEVDSSKTMGWEDGDEANWRPWTAEDDKRLDDAMAEAKASEHPSEELLDNIELLNLVKRYAQPEPSGVDIVSKHILDLLPKVCPFCEFGTDYRFSDDVQHYICASCAHIIPYSMIGLEGLDNHYIETQFSTVTEV